jgi:hypothetical protein
MPAGEIVASDSITLALPSFQAGAAATSTCGTWNVTADGHTALFSGGSLAAMEVCTITSTGWTTPTMPQMANASYRTVNITSAIDYNNMWL